MRSIHAGAAILAAVVIALLAASCSDSPRPAAITATATPGETASPDFGPVPALGDHVRALIPPHGSSLPQAATRTIDPSRPQPPCFAADFSDLPQQAQWFRVLLDGEEVTPRLTWVIPASPGSTRLPRACLATETGLAPGVHTIVIVVRDPLSASAPDLERVSWSFQVTP